jgi:gamma-butyrobetaine dioxygenase
MADVELRDRWLRVHLPRGHADFHYKWLRLACDGDRHPLTRERTLDSCDVADDVRPRAAWVADGALHVDWQGEERRSRYGLAWLEEHAYALLRDAAPPPPCDVDAVSLVWSERALGDVAVEALAVVERHGLAVVRRASARAVPEDETEALIDAFGAAGLAVVGTHFGRVEDLRTDNTTNANTDQLGYTDAPIELHTDQPFLDHPPRYQLLQSLRTATAGGENYLVDARAAADHLRSEDAEAYRLLSSVPVRFHRRQRAFERLVVSPILGVGPDGRFLVRYSYFTTEPHRLPFAELEPYLRAYDRFARLVRDPRHQVRFALAPGDFVLYDNHRMLHARTAFSGPRWVRGVYFDAGLA